MIHVLDKHILQWNLFKLEMDNYLKKNKSRMLAW